MLSLLASFHSSLLRFGDWFVSMAPLFCFFMTISFSISTSHWHFLAICFVFSLLLSSFSPISLYRACSPPSTLSLTFRGTWWKSNCPTQLVSLFILSYLHHAIVCVSVCVCVRARACVAMFASSLTSAVLPQCHLAAARFNQFWPWKLPQMSTALNIKRLNSLFVCTCVCVREQQRVHAGVLEITRSTWRHVSTAPLVCQRRRAFS